MFGRRWNRDVRNPGVKIDRISGRYRGGLLMKENPRRGGGTGKTRLQFVLNCCTGLENRGWHGLEVHWVSNYDQNTCPKLKIKKKQ